MIKGDDSRFTWDNPGSLVFNQCSKCRSKFLDKLGCIAYPELIPLEYRKVEDWKRCEYFNDGFRDED